MDALLIVARLLLAAVFAVAAVGKLRDVAGTRRALAGFRVPARLRSPLSLGLPLLELAIAALLVPAPTARIGALAAAVLLLAFTVALISVLVRGEEVECNCLGSVSRRPVSALTVARNVALSAVAGFVALAGPGASAVSWLDALSTTEAVGLGIAAALAVACAVNFAFSWQLLKQNGRLRVELAAIEGAEARETDLGAAIGDPAPAFGLASLAGEELSLRGLLEAGRGATVLFSDAACSACDPLLPTIGRLQRDERVGPVVMIVNGDVEAARVKAAEHGIAPVLFQEDFELARSYGVPGIPAVVRIGEDGRIADRGIGAVESAGLLAGLGVGPELGEALLGGGA